MSENQIQLFKYEGNEVRTVVRDGEPWWVLKDVCDALGLGTPARVAERLEEDEVSLTHITDAVGRRQETSIINESGLYNVILRSDKPEAKTFKRWITREVLPAIRKHGAYATPDTVEKWLQDPDGMIQVLTTLKAERVQRQRLELKQREDAPKVAFADSVAVAESSILVGEMAKLIKQGTGHDIGQNRFFEFLRSNGYVHRKGEQRNLPTQWSVEHGWMEIKEGTRSTPDGVTIITHTPKITGRGQIHFVNLFKK